MLVGGFLPSAEYRGSANYPAWVVAGDLLRFLALVFFGIHGPKVLSSPVYHLQYVLLPKPRALRSYLQLQVSQCPRFLFVIGYNSTVHQV